MKDNIHFLEDGYYVEKLQQENQQLKEMFEASKTYSKQFLYKHNKKLLEANERLRRKNERLKEIRNLAVQKVNEEREKNVNLEIPLHKYKEVIEEVREYIEKSSLEVNTREYGMLTVCDSDNLLQILDKVKDVK